MFKKEPGHQGGGRPEVGKGGSGGGESKKRGGTYSQRSSRVKTLGHEKRKAEVQGTIGDEPPKDHVKQGGGVGVIS